MLVQGGYVAAWDVKAVAERNVAVSHGGVGRGEVRRVEAVTVWWGIVCCFAVGQGGHGVLTVGLGAVRCGLVSRSRRGGVR